MDNMDMDNMDKKMNQDVLSTKINHGHMQA